MARHASAEKAARQAVRHQRRNQSVRADCRTTVKKLKAAMVKPAGGNAEAKKALQDLLADVQRTLMKAASKNVMKKKTASRNISRLSAAVDRVLNSATA